MDKQKLIDVAKDQLKGGIAKEQVRELLAYRGIDAKEVDAIMEAVLAGDDARPAQLSGQEIVERTHEAFLEVSKEAPLNPDAARKERIIILGALVGGIILAVVGSIVYFKYF